MSDRQMRAHCRLEGAAQAMLDGAFEQLGLSARALTRILKVARTLADLAGRADDRRGRRGRSDPVPQPRSPDDSVTTKAWFRSKPLADTWTLNG